MARYMEANTNTLFLSGSLEQLLPNNSVARTLLFALEKLDFSTFDQRYRNDDTGRPALHPRRLLALWILALLRGIDSSVALAKLCKSDIEFRWLAQDLGVEKSTLCIFRKHCQAQLQEISLDILSALGKGGLLPASKLGLDGTVLRAASSCHQCKTKKQLDKKRRQLETQIKQKLEQVDAKPAKSIDTLKQHQEKVRQALTSMDTLGLKKDTDRLTLTEHDAKYMRLKDGAFAPAYNAQAVSDLESGAIVHARIIQQGGDGGQLQPQLKQARETLTQVAKRNDTADVSAKPTDVVADAAYHDTRQLVNLVQENITPCVPNTRADTRTPPDIKEGFEAKHFRHDPQSDTLTCPAGKTLKRRKLNDAQTAVRYQAKKADCVDCPFKHACCPKTKDGRTVNRPLFQKELEAIAAHVDSEAGRELAARRRTTVEGNMSRLKTLLNWRKCRCWGLLGAQAELLLRQITNNLMLLTQIWKPLVLQTA